MYRRRHSETPTGENQNIFVTLTVRTYVWIGPDWTFQQSLGKSTERQVWAVSYVGENQGSLWCAIYCTWPSVLMAIICCKVQLRMIRAQVRTVSLTKWLWFSLGGVWLCYSPTVGRLSKDKALWWSRENSLSSPSLPFLSVLPFDVNMLICWDSGVVCQITFG